MNADERRFFAAAEPPLPEADRTASSSETLTGLMIWFLSASMSKFVQHLERTPNDGMSFLLARVVARLRSVWIRKIICVHLGLSAVEISVPCFSADAGHTAVLAFEHASSRVLRSFSMKILTADERR